jgi:hypothetical protein
MKKRLAERLTQACMLLLLVIFPIIDRLKRKHVLFKQRFPPSVIITIFLFWQNSPRLARASSCLRFLDLTQRRTTVGRTPLDE